MLYIKVPATTANIGPGFDTLGIALTLYNKIKIKKSNNKIFNWGSTNLDIPNKENFILTSLDYTLKKYNKDLGYEIEAIEMNIPVSRGLGSSASSIVLGIYAAFYIMNKSFNKSEILNIATEIEGHPDNVAPAIFGGMISSIVTDKRIIYTKTKFPNNIKFNVLIPNFKLSTYEMRKVLPKEFSKEDCIFNISRVAVLINSLNNNELENLKVALNDKIHQPYRLNLIENGKSIFNFINKTNSLGYFISGAGPTLISLEKTENFSNNKEILEKFLNSLENSWKVLSLDVDKEGAKAYE